MATRSLSSSTFLPLLVCALVLGGCSCDSESMPDASMGDGGPSDPEICDNGIDDDGDGATDCEDVECVAFDMAAQDGRTVDRPFLERVRFLWEGGVCPPLQLEAETVSLERRDIAAINGRVTRDDGGPLGGVRVDVLGHPELGHTLTRGDGAFDLAVIPGSELVVRFAADGFISAQRNVRSLARAYASTEPVELMTLGAGTMVDMARGGVARSESSSDEDGERSATILFPAGTEARVRGADGSMTTVSSLMVRPREFTVGPRGADRMVSTLPAASAYTYAIELGVNDGEDVFFDRPVPVYVSDFLNMPVGAAVPIGSYDRVHGRWVPEDDGLVVEVVGVRDGLAELDLDGDGSADDVGELGARDEELRALASEHSVGTRLWRFAPDHFSPWDLNWPFAFPPGAIVPAIAGLLGGDAFIEDSCAPGSEIRVQRQILGEQVGVLGTGMSLHYTSDRHPAYESPRSIQLQITPDEIPPSLKEVRVELDVAGQRVRQTRVPEAGTIFNFTWNGNDRFGRRFRGPASYTLRIGYVYDGDYATGGAEGAGLSTSFGRGGGERIDGSPTREEIVAWQELHGVLRFNDALTDGLLGLTLSSHHRYEPLGETLLMGNGQTIRGAAVPRIIERLAGLEGTETSDPAVEGDIATNVDFSHIVGVAVGPSGRVHFSVRRQHQIWRIEEDGRLTLVAGTGREGSTGDGGPARDADIERPAFLAFGPDGALYFTSPTDEAESTHTIRRIRADGVIETFAGTGEEGDADDALGDGLLAVDAPLEDPSQLAFGSDGTLYFLDGLRTIRSVDPGGRLRTINPGATRERLLDADGTPLSRADIGALGAFAIDRDDTLYLGTLGGEVFRAGPDRMIQRVAGGGDVAFEDAIDVGPQEAIRTRLRAIRALAVGLGGELWIVDSTGGRLLRLSSGQLTRAAGGTRAGWPGGNGGPAASAVLTNVTQIAVDDENRLLLADTFPSDQVRRIRAGFGARRSDEWVIPSSDGTLRFVFNLDGRHLRTETSLTGALVHEFAYDADGRVRSLTDAHGNQLLIDASGDSIVIRPTEGPATRLVDEDGDGYVDRIFTDGDSRETRFEWRGEGQLVGFTDRIGVMHEFDYDALGRLTLDGIVGGAMQRIDRDGDAVTLTTGGGRAATWGAERESGERTQRYTDASGVSVQRTMDDEGVQTTRYEDGSEIEVVLRPDAVLGSAVSVPVSTIIRTPSGLQAQWTMEQESTVTEGVLDERTTRITTNVDTPREATTTQRLAITADGGSVFEVTSSAGRQGTMVRNPEGELVEITQPGRYPVRLEYDDQGRLVRALQGPEGLPDEARILSWTLPTIPSDSFGDVEVEDATGRSVRAGFDGRGRADEVSDAIGSTGFGFDESARSFTVTPPGRGAHEFALDSRGFMSTYTPPGTEGAESFEFDDDGVAVSMNFAGSRATVQVDESFRGRGATFGEGNSSAVDFDDFGDVSARTWIQPGGQIRVAPSYDGPLVTSVVMSGSLSATFTPTYDEALELSAMRIDAGGETGEVSWNRDSDGLMNSMTLATSVTHAIPLTLDRVSGDLTSMRSRLARSDFDIDGFGSLEIARHTWPAGGNLGFGYTRDRAGRIEAVTETGAPDTTFEFDERGRLTSALEADVERYGYDYDANGNRIGWRLPSGTCEGAACTEYDEQDRLMRYGSGADTVRYEYNGAGQRTVRTDAAGTTRTSYDSLGHLNSVTLPDGRVVSYLHDPSGARTTRSVDGTRTHAWLQAGGRISAQLDADGALEVVYGYVTKDWVPDWAIHRDGRLFRVVSDHVGSVRLVVDAETGEVAQRYRYSPYGALEQDVTNEAIVPHRFAGGHYDEATGLLRFGARDYDPEVGRWTNKDPLGFAAGDTNLYAYVGGDPVNGVDPSGLFVDTLTDGIAVSGCIFALARDNVFGSCGNLADNLTDCAIAASAFVLPFVSYGMLKLGGRLQQRLKRTPDMPCGAGLCPCFVAGTLVGVLAMSGASVAHADADAAHAALGDRTVDVHAEYVDSHVAIETLQVGERVQTALLADLLDDDDDDARRTEVTRDWRVVDLELRGDGSRDAQVLLTVLRPPDWLDSVDPDGDGAFELELPELRLRGLAHVICVRGPPRVSDGPGRVVLATVEHPVARVLALRFEGAGETGGEVVRTTANHPFYSVTRGWTAAGELQRGERVETREGERALVGAAFEEGTQAVFNLEVEGDHEYLVGNAGLRVHNTCAATRRAQTAGDATVGSERAARRRAMREHGMATSRPNGFQRTPVHGRNPNLKGPNGEPSEVILGRDLHGNPVEIQHHSNGHTFEDNGTFELPHYHGTNGHISYLDD